MEARYLVEGRLYAYREKRSAGTPLQKVTFLEKLPRREKIRIRFEDGDFPGLVDYASTRQIVVPWGERKRLLQDEAHAAELAEHASKIADETIGLAVSAVLESTGENGGYADSDVSFYDEDTLQRIIDRAGLEVAPVDLHRLAYRDRHDQIHVPLDGLIPLAQAFAAVEPKAVLDYIDEWEQELRDDALVRHNSFFNKYRRQHDPAHALARRWATPENETSELRKEIARLRALVARAAGDLRDADRPKEARSILREMDRRPCAS